jgi:hypothetical protein
LLTANLAGKRKFVRNTPKQPQTNFCTKSTKVHLFKGAIGYRLYVCKEAHFSNIFMLLCLGKFLRQGKLGWGRLR